MDAYKSQEIQEDDGCPLGTGGGDRDRESEGQGEVRKLPLRWSVGKLW